MAVVIDKGVPLPAISGGRSTGPWLAARTMEVGDSFLLPVDYSFNSKQSFVGNCNRMFAPKKFVGRKELETRRIWRIA